MAIAIPKTELEIREAIKSVYADPEGYAEMVFPWGRKGTVLEKAELRRWQRDFLYDWGRDIHERGFDGTASVKPILKSTVSGHGIGKSALSAIITKFIHDTRPHSVGTLTANTATQLRTRTWAEVGKWHRMSLTAHWSEYYASRGNMALVNKFYPEDWFVNAFTAKKENAEAFAGQHAVTSTSFYLFDESSGIAEEIFVPMYGGLTDGEPMAFLFGNGTRNSGEFYRTHHRLRHRWDCRAIDARDVEGANLDYFQELIDDYGLDSDFVRVRVLGQFPKGSSLQFISALLVDFCQSQEISHSLTDPLIYGVDVARYGDDQSVLYKRRGKDAVTPGIHKFRELDPTDYAAFIAQEAARENPDAIFVDGGGVGGPVVDMLRKLHVANVIEINGAWKATGKECANMRAQCWWNMREAMKLGLALPMDDDLRDDLIGLEYGWRITDNKMLLEKKEYAKSRGIASPDIADALSLTYALPVARRSPHAREHGHTGRNQGRPSNLVTDHTG